MGAPGGHTWPQDLDSLPGPAWPCLGPRLMGEARPAPDICQAQGVRGLGDSPLTHFSPGCQGVSREGPGYMGLDSAPSPSLSCVCRTACWGTNPWRTPGQPQSSTASPGDFNGSLRILVAACGISFPDQGSNLALCVGCVASSSLDHQGSPYFLSLHYFRRSQ